MPLLDGFDLPALARELGALGADGWLLYDFRKVNPIAGRILGDAGMGTRRDRKSTRLNSSHSQISYAVFCLKKKRKVASPTKLQFQKIGNTQLRHEIPTIYWI